MSIAQVLRTIARADGGDGLLGERLAAELFGRLLDGGVEELELGAVLGALAMRPLTGGELSGFARAVAARSGRLSDASTRLSRGVLPVSIPSYSGNVEQPNLMPALALLLARFGVPVLVHGSLEAQGRVAGAAVLRELGVLPSTSLPEAQLAIAGSGIAFVPTALLSPALAQLIALRARLGVAGCAQMVARLLDPFAGGALRLVPACDALERAAFAAALAGDAGQALLFVGAEGEAFPAPQQRPAIELYQGSERRVLFEAEAGAAGPLPAAQAAAADAKAAARWIGQAIVGKEPLPPPLSNLLACCLYGAGYCDDFNQSKAIVALRTHALGASRGVPDLLARA
jgi:anthranilate phosphoribosyltransferase